MRAALTFSESNLLEFVEFAPPAAQLAAEIARSLEPVLGVLWKNFFAFLGKFLQNFVIFEFFSVIFAQILMKFYRNFANILEC